MKKGILTWLGGGAPLFLPHESGSLSPFFGPRRGLHFGSVRRGGMKGGGREALALPQPRVPDRAWQWAITIRFGSSYAPLSSCRRWTTSRWPSRLA